MADITSLLASGMPSTTSSNASSTPWPMAQSLLEASIPGFSVLSGLAKFYFHVDLTSIVYSLLPLAIAIAAFKYFYDPVHFYMMRYGVSTAEIRNDDEMYNYIMYWLSQQKFSSNTLSFVATTRTSSQLFWDPYDDEHEGDDMDEETDWQLAEDDFEAYWAQTTKRDKVRNVYFTPCNGRVHWFKYKGQRMALERTSSERQYGWRATRSETIHLFCLGRDPAVIKELLREAQRAYVERDGNSTVIYRKGDGDDWQRCMARPPRPLSTVVLDKAQKDNIVQDIREYLHPLTKRWYTNRGIPYRRGYLLYGPPGTGKTSLCVALAGMFGLKVYVASLNSRTLTEESLATLFGYLPQRCVVLLEDVDSAGITHKRGEEPVDVKKPTDEPTPDKPPSSDKPSGISLSALLNIIDGVASSEGRILIMTTNHAEKLDPALLRPGRVDMSIAFENATTLTAQELFKSTYVSHEEDYPAQKDKKGKHFQLKRKFDFTDDQIANLATKFSTSLPSGEFSPADIQGYLLKHKATPDQAAGGVLEWTSKVREEREKQKTPISVKPAEKEGLKVPATSEPAILTPPKTPEPQ